MPANALALSPSYPLSSAVPRDPRALLESWLAGLTERTREAYRSDLQDFAKVTGEEASAAMLSRRAGAANELALAWRTSMMRRNLASATINRRLAALRSLVEALNLVDAVQWSLRVRNVKHEPRWDCRGPNEEGIKAVREELERRTGPKGVRDRAMWALLDRMALRRFEVVGLDLEHVDVAGTRIAPLRKGKRERRWLEVPPAAMAPLLAWLRVRGEEPGPLFTAFRRGLLTRCGGEGLYRLVRAAGQAAGVPGLRPHKVRHSSTTRVRARALEKGIPLERIRDFTGHADTKTLEMYLDRDKSMQGELAALA